jgi:hypothetical protein
MNPKNKKLKTMKKLLLNTILLSFIAFSGNAQQTMDYMDPGSSGTLYRNNVLNKKTVSKIEGSKYLVDEFRTAKISGVPELVMVRYDALTDIIEVQNEKKEIFSLVKKPPYSTITILPYNDIIHLMNYNTKEGEVNGYLMEIFSSNKIAFYRRDRIALQKGKEAVNSYLSATAPRYVATNGEYYLSFKNETAVPMPKDKKEFQQLFPIKKDEIDVYLKKNHFSLKDEKSIVEMAKFLSTF